MATNKLHNNQIISHANTYPAVIALAESIQKKFEKVNYEQSNFPEIAAEELKKYPHIEISPKLVAKWLAENSHPFQLQSNPQLNLFGEPAVTLFWSKEFVIDAYFWRTVDTIIHDHGFHGAFKVMQGLTLHTQYDFQVTACDQDEGIKVGKLIRTGLHYLTKESNVVKIYGGESLIHSTAHLEKPTITLCIRTVRDASIQQYNYYPPGLAIAVKAHHASSLCLAVMPLLQECALSDLLPYTTQIIKNKNLVTAAYAIQYYLALTGNINDAQNLAEQLVERYPAIYCQEIKQSLNYIYITNDINIKQAKTIKTKTLCEILKSSYEKDTLIPAIQNLYPKISPIRFFNEAYTQASQEGAISLNQKNGFNYV